MNAKNAQYIGRQEGKSIQHQVQFSSKEEYINHGKQVAEFNTRYFKTAALYLEGWTEAWIEPEAPKPPKQHNPNTRFCDCPACMGEEQSQPAEVEQVIERPTSTFIGPDGESEILDRHNDTCDCEACETYCWQIAERESQVQVKRCGTCGEEKPISHFTEGECNSCHFAEPVEDDDLTPDDLTALDEAMSQPDSRPYTSEELAAMVEEAEGSEPEEYAECALCEVELYEGHRHICLKCQREVCDYDYMVGMYLCKACHIAGMTTGELKALRDAYEAVHRHLTEFEDMYLYEIKKELDRRGQEALQHAWDELQATPSLVETETHQIALQTEMQARDAVCSEAFSDFCKAELERELQTALNSSCWDIEDKATQERLLALSAMREQEDRETAEFYRVMAEAQ